MATQTIWNGSANAQPHPTQDTFYFLRNDDQQNALSRGFAQPIDVINARVQGDSENTHDILLVCLGSGTTGSFAGNAAYITMNLNYPGAKHDTFADTAAKAKDAGRVAWKQLPMFMTSPRYDQVRVDSAWQLRTRSGNSFVFMASQAHWTGDLPPPTVAVLEPLQAYCQVDDLQHQGRPVMSINGRPLKDFDHILPRLIPEEITLQEYSWLMVAWRSSDPRIDWTDILDRMPQALQPNQDENSKKNKFRSADARWREANHMLSWKKSSKTVTASKDMASILQGLTPEQMLHNTSWTLHLTNKGLIRRPNNAEPDVWHVAPHIHPASASLNQQPQQTQGDGYTKRVHDALVTQAQRGGRMQPIQTGPAANSRGNANLRLNVSPERELSAEEREAAHIDFFDDPTGDILDVVEDFLPPGGVRPARRYVSNTACEALTGQSLLADTPSAEDSAVSNSCPGYSINSRPDLAVHRPPMGPVQRAFDPNEDFGTMMRRADANVRNDIPHPDHEEDRFDNQILDDGPFPWPGSHYEREAHWFKRRE